MSRMQPRMAPAGLAREWLALGLTLEVPPRRALALVEALRSPGAVLRAPEDRLLAAGVTETQVAALRQAAARVPAEVRRLAAAGATAVTWADPTYPERLREIPDPPVWLAVRGDLPVDAPCVAVVGARRASEYGRRMAEALGRGLAQAGVTVVSGLAAGIDGAAHRGALEAGGQTIAVLGTGIDRVYPSWHAELAARVVGQGALVSEFPCATPPLAYNFPRRNRVISGLSLATVVVEAAEESGSLITAEYAADQGRLVLAVPGPADAPSHRGPHRLIREGATLVTGVEDVLAAVAPQCADRLAATRAATAAATLTDVERRVLAAMGGEGRHVDDLIRRVDLPPGSALETLLALELRGLVAQLPGKRFRPLAA
jgi:DNA processing protein